MKTETPTNHYYFCGGEYDKGSPGKPDYQFFLVSPSGTNGPYITQGERDGRDLFRHCKHHSHLYRLDGQTARLVSEGESQKVRAPMVYTLSPVHLAEVESGMKNIWSLRK